MLKTDDPTDSVRAVKDNG